MQSSATYAIVRQNVCEYLRFRGNDAERRVMAFINSEILSFLRLRNWRRLTASVDITVPVSGELNIPTYFAAQTTPLEPFAQEIALISGGAKMPGVLPVDYAMSSSGVFTIEGETLKVTAGDYTLVYKTPGLPYPFTEVNKDTNTGPRILHYYSDIIECMAALAYLRYIHDWETAATEERRLSILLQTAQIDENRSINDTARHVITRGASGG